METKIMENSTKKFVYKQSLLEKNLNKIIFGIFFSQIIIMVITGVLNSLTWTADFAKKHNYLKVKYTDSVSGALTSISYLLLHNNMLPSSMAMALEVTKFFLGCFINWDVNMYSKKNKGLARCQTSNIIEELGQIKFLFTDKTGTLTSNSLKLRACIIGNESFGISKEDYPNDENPENEVEQIKFRDVISEIKDSINFKMQRDSTNLKQQSLISNFILNMAINHTCYIKRSDVTLKDQPNGELPLESTEDLDESEEVNEYKVNYDYFMFSIKGRKSRRV